MTAIATATIKACYWVLVGLGYALMAPFVLAEVVAAGIRKLAGR